MSQRTKLVVSAIAIGMSIGIFIIHPTTTLIREFFHWHRGEWHLHWYELADALATAYSVQHMPNALVYGILTALVSYLWLRSVDTYRQIAEQSERFAIIGRESSTIVHDINNPLFGVTAFTQLIREEVDDPELLDFCNRIEGSANRISGLVAEIKTLAAGKGNIILQKKLVILSELAEKIAREINLSARLDIRKNAQSAVPIDALYFGRVLLNIFKNADDALRGEKDGVITLSMQTGDRYHSIEIANNGPNIPPSIIKTLFKLGVTKGKEHGTGLGLYASQRIVNAHGGKISARNPEGGGAVFVISLPVEKMEE